MSFNVYKLKVFDQLNISDKGLRKRVMPIIKECYKKGFPVWVTIDRLTRLESDYEPKWLQPKH